MSAVFIITLIFLAAVAYTLYRKQQELNSFRADNELGPVRPRSLFEDGPDSAARQPRQLPEESGRAGAEQQQQQERQQRREQLLARAREGDYTTLAAAHGENDPPFYHALLAELMNRAARSGRDLGELASFIATDKELRSNAALSDAYVELWKAAPDLTTTARMLHLAALADDADAFRRAVDAAVAASQAGRLPQVSPGDLRALIESEFWVMTTEARVTGAGFVLKQRLAALREELAP